MKKTILAMLMAATTSLMASNASFFVGANVGGTTIENYMEDITGSAVIMAGEAETAWGVRTGLVIDENHRIMAGYDWFDTEFGTKITSYSAEYDYLFTNLFPFTPFAGVGIQNIDYDLDFGGGDIVSFGGLQWTLNFGVVQKIGHHLEFEAGYNMAIATSEEELVDNLYIDIDNYNKAYIALNYKF